jgi:hypothetical protein
MEFPIDIVYTWVDGNDFKHQELLSQYTGQKLYNRFANNNEIYYSLYSVYRFAPWTRNIFIVTADYQRPNIIGLPLELISKIRFIKHSQILPKSSLPIFQSYAIESCLHKIPDLAEHFIYFNDDMFLGNHVIPADFFSAEGHCFFFSGKWFVPTFHTFYFLDAWLNTFHQTIKLFETTFIKRRNFRIYRRSLHQCYPCSKVILNSLWEDYPQFKAQLEQNVHEKLRSGNGFNTIYLMQLVGLYKKQFVYRRGPSQFFINLSLLDIIFKYRLMKIHILKPKLICVNNNLTRRKVSIERFFQNQFQKYYRLDSQNDSSNQEMETI